MADDSDVEPVASSGLAYDDEMIASSISHSKRPTGSVDHGMLSTSSSKDSDELSFQRKKCKMKDEKSCGVCGDKALGYNFNAITCESCKAFFRRNALKDKAMVCLFENKCVIDIRTRRFCPACRIRKCYSIGMNREMILDDSEKKKRLGKVMANRAKRDSTSKSETPQPTEIKTEVDPDEALNELTSGLHVFSEVKNDTNALSKAYATTSDTLFKHVPKELLPVNPSMFYQLRDDESSILDAITNVFKSTLGAMLEHGPYEEENEYKKPADLVNHSEIVVRKLIVFVKHLEDFKLLSQEDKMAALKACVMKTILFRSSVFYIIERDSWITPNGEVPSRVLRNATGFVSLHNSHVLYCQRMKSMALDDYSIFALLQAMIIFDPAGPNISNRGFMSTLQDRYLILLKHYLESQFSYEYAKEYYVAAMDRLCDLKVLGDEHAKVLLHVNPVEVEPLMLEVLNLK